MITRRKLLANIAVLASAAGSRLPVWSYPLKPSAATVPGGQVEHALLLGVDYYPDQTPESLWEEDARMIAEAGLTNVRVAEFAWSLMEPSEGKFDFAWLKKSVGILNAHGIQVILGTPSAAPPPWLTEKYPQVLLVNSEGATVHPGGRRFTCPTNQTYRKLALAVASEMAKNFSDTPGVIGWQIDNEFTLQQWGRCYCKYCREGFQDWARQKYGTLDVLNQKWGTAFWSQIYTDWRQIPVPLPSNGEPNPGLALDYDRYQSYAYVSFCNEQLAMLRQKCPRHFVTTNNVGGIDTVDLRELFRGLDFVCHDNYPGFVAIYFAEANLSAEQVATSTSMSHDIMRSVKDGKPFLIMEEQAGKAGQSFFAPQPHPGQLRLWAFQAVAHGAMGVNYFRWDSANFGAEEYWHGLLNHDRSKSPGFEEIVQTVKEMKTLGKAGLEAPYVADAALSYDLDSDWALAIQPGNRKLNYRGQVSAWYGSLASAGTGVDIVKLENDLSKYKAVFAPVQYVLSEKQAESIRNYVKNGGTFVTNFRVAVKDETSQIVKTPLPGLLRDVLGVTVKDYVPLYGDKVGVKFSGELAGPDATCALWADLLTPHTAKVLANYTGAYGEEAAITVNSFGKGKAVYIGADLDVMSLARVLRTLLAISGSKSDIEAPRGVEVTRRKAGSVEWTYILNHSSETQRIPLPGRFKSALNGEAHNAELQLQPYGVAVLQRA
ncbi:MAG TPA: beta-galactosidase [Dongiaceae bacterium]|nr:beta-galactosidase [Dongiaceae bacterium]